MVVDDVRDTLRERIDRGATFDELDTIVRMTRGLTEGQRRALWQFAWYYELRPTRRRGSTPSESRALVLERRRFH